MSIWFKPYTLADLHIRGGMPKHLGMEFTEIGPDFLTLRMPVDDRTHQPDGILHGAAKFSLPQGTAEQAAPGDR